MMFYARKKNVRKELDVFVSAFQKRLRRTPYEYIDKKIKAGSRIEDVEYLFNIVSAEIAQENKCEFFDFDNFYTN